MAIASDRSSAVELRIHTLALGPWAWHRTGVKFDDEDVRLRFLEGIRLHGRNEMAAHKAGISLNSIRNWQQQHPEEGKAFKEAWDLARVLHGQDIVMQLENEAIHGHKEPIFDKDGKRVGEKVKYETALRAMVMKRYDSEYREKTEVTHKSETGVMVVPHPVASVADWANLVQSAKDEAAAKAAAQEKRKEDT